MNHTASNDGLIFASAYIPYQNSDFEDLFEPDEALCRGTIFPELYLPQLGMEAFYER